ncbi:MAG: hypothetical protein CM1200mP22_15410 [Dehalococcoidia bacterium]|nr:MAG: hypothetical protein CM1200mP22_15410 [Dehalococcoidia bacterium]
MRNRSIMLLLIADAGNFLVQYTAFTGWLPTFYNEHRGISLSQAGFITGILPFVGVFAVLAGGAVALRVTSPRTLFVASGLLAGFGGLGAFLMPELGLIYPSVVLLSIGSWLYVPTLLTLPIQMHGMTPERVAVVWGSFLTFRDSPCLFRPYWWEPFGIFQVHFSRVWRSAPSHHGRF